MRLTLSLILITLMAAVSLYASDRGTMSAKCLKLFKKFDRNGDNFLQRTEFDKAIKSKDINTLKKAKKQHSSGDEPAFSDVDTNQDKKLSESEFQVYLRYR